MAMTNAEKQAAWRDRREVYIKDLEKRLRNQKRGEDLERARRRIEALGPPWQLSEPSGGDRNFYIHGAG